MVFDNPEDAQTFYTRYARRVGFGIRKNHKRLSQSDKLLIGVDYTFSREEQPKQSNEGKTKSSKTNQSETKIGCKAMMSVSLRREEEKWVVTRFVTYHNHELYTPRTTSLLRGHRKITPAQKNLINVLNESGIPATKIMSVLSHGSGGESNVGCALIDVQNHIGNKRRELLKEGDAQRMHNYFMECQSKNPGFVYSIQLDDNNRMGNFFWANTRSRLAYQYFGDVVTFDATYLTNHYSMPFVPFTGVNHHHQSVMFGCALLVNETTSSYVWLLRTWLEAMFGRASSVIIIDED
ncbi:PREDICTED: protein FAR1-RELATED SEQUENCE 5-like [Erythranthe guttata]|uniref:protein FAR1-RELATED SEQUENCE 5-like n=1 Tax=Erythranthe guttata TaxID=4155 RepID=UPI00064DA53D|nr:PREDICTED: protein FAR1-RELATED SEQUENCE 5-like [Erythranthe guttata]|eukprot:XP_012833069.1 PREDICTED: protein FAR1-RELATED SEQUENCE 5-like [Erythranthe guttata]